MSASRVAIVLWAGEVFGGAETASISLARALGECGLAVEILFVGEAGVYRPVLESAGVRYSSVGLTRGSKVLLHPMRFANALSASGADCAILPSAGYLALAARAGGYRGAIVSVEHGGLLQEHRLPVLRRLALRADRRLSRGSIDAQVAVSDFVMQKFRNEPHAMRLVRIHNGVETGDFAAARTARADRRADDPTVVIGSAGKLMDGKGFEDIVSALAQMACVVGWRAEIAGDGPMRGQLQRMVTENGLDDRVAFRGWVENMPAFWSGCDIGVAASNRCVESFGMTVAEAMASGIAVVVSRSGGMPEVLGDFGAGITYDPGDVPALREALTVLVGDETKRNRAADAGLARARELDIGVTARAYSALIYDVIGARRE